MILNVGTVMAEGSKERTIQGCTSCSDFPAPQDIIVVKFPKLPIQFQKSTSQNEFILLFRAVDVTSLGAKVRVFRVSLVRQLK